MSRYHYTPQYPSNVFPWESPGENESERVSSSKCKLQVCYGPILFDVSTVPYGNEIKLGVDFKTIIEVITSVYSQYKSLGNGVSKISIIIFVAAFLATRYKKANPILVMLVCGVLGLIIYSSNPQLRA